MAGREYPSLGTITLKFSLRQESEFDPEDPDYVLVGVHQMEVIEAGMTKGDL